MEFVKVANLRKMFCITLQKFVVKLMSNIKKNRLN